MRNAVHHVRTRSIQDAAHSVPQGHYLGTGLEVNASAINLVGASSVNLFGTLIHSVSQRMRCG